MIHKNPLNGLGEGVLGRTDQINRHRERVIPIHPQSFFLRESIKAMSALCILRLQFYTSFLPNQMFLAKTLA